jgi:hypothetical protein
MNPPLELVSTQQDSVPNFAEFGRNADICYIFTMLLLSHARVLKNGGSRIRVAQAGALGAAPYFTSETL